MSWGNLLGSGEDSKYFSDMVVFVKGYLLMQSRFVRGLLYSGSHAQ